MAATANNPLPVDSEVPLQEETLWQRFLDWVRTELVWYAGSFSFHLLALSVLLLLPNVGQQDNLDDNPVLVSKADEEVAKKEEEWKFNKPDIGEIDDAQPEKLIVDPTLQPPPQEDQKAESNDNSPVFERKGHGDPNGVKGLGPSDGAMAFGHGPKLIGPGDMGPVLGRPDGTGPGGLGRGDRRAKVGRRGGNPHTEAAVNAALVWLANHQFYDGHWSLQHYVDNCKDKSCSGTGEVPADAGATAMGLLPFLATGETHLAKGPYKEHIRRGIDWLIRNQQPDGNLAKGAVQMMYSHGLATIALSEAYGLSGDRRVGMAAQGAVNFILNAQNTADGGWRYNPKDPGDTSVVGWQLMALKSAHMAGLNVGGSVFSGTSKWLDSVAVHDGAEYAYQPGNPSSNTMTSVGLLCRQYLGAKRDSPMLTGGMSYLLNHLPDEGFPNVYYWYYATQVMHNMSGYEWDTWNRKIRELLVHSQVRGVDQCANGSWAPEKDAWGRHGGRLMTTSLSCLTLEVYYRYLPLFKPETSGGEGAAVAAAPAHGAGARPGKATKTPAAKKAVSDTIDLGL